MPRVARWEQATRALSVVLQTSYQHGPRRETRSAGVVLAHGFGMVFSSVRVNIDTRNDRTNESCWLDGPDGISPAHVGDSIPPASTEFNPTLEFGRSTRELRCVRRFRDATTG